MRSVALLTPTHRADIERFDLLCESVDRRVNGYERHYVIVNDEDMSLFGRYATERRVVQPASKFLPAWLWAMPRFLSRNGRRVWLSLLSGPVHGWHVQQLLKIGGTLAAAEDRVCIVDSDNLFFRDFDVRSYAGHEQTPLYIDAKSIESGKPNHATWTENAHQLLGLPEPTFPADDYVGNLIVWDKATLKAMTEHIRLVTGQDWRLALCRRKQFSEYLLYGAFVVHAPDYRARHRIVEESLACAHWETDQLSEAGVRSMIESAESRKVALCIQSYSGTAATAIRSAVSNARTA